MTARLLPLALALLLFPLGYWVGQRASTPAPAAATPTANVAPLTVSPKQSATMPTLGGYNAEIDGITAQIMASKPLNLDLDLARHAEGLFYLLFESFAAERPREAALLAQKIQDEGRRKFALAEAGKNWGESEPLAALAWLNQLPKKDYRDAFDAVYCRVASGNPSYAAQQLSTVTDPAVRNEAIHRAATEWARVDPAATFAWLEQFPNPEERLLAQKAALLAHAMSKPIEAFSKLQALPEGNSKREIARSLGTALADEDLETSLVWARDIKDPNMQSSVLEGIAYQLDVAFADGEFNAQLKNIPSAQAADMIDVILPLTQRSFAEAAAAIPKLPPAKAEFLIERIAGQWSREDPVAARRWAESLPPGSGRDASLQIIAESTQPAATD